MRTLGSSTTIAAWWDYGYWIAVMGNVTSLADNATINETQISHIGEALMVQPKQSIQVLKNDLHSPEYVLIFIAGYRFQPSTQSGSSQLYYMLTVPTPFPQPAGGDESKKQWFIRIGNGSCGCLQETVGSQALMEPDDFTPTPYFWNSSTLGQLIPFQSQALYYNPVLAQGGQGGTAQGYNQTINSQTGASGISNGYTEIYTYQMKYPTGDTKTPFQLAFQSSSLPGTGGGLFTAVLVYKVNYNYTSAV
jgi:dolichyl-diphosphooligosaccharide---protein glycosyltransferase